jgi:hypothetical protein
LWCSVCIAFCSDAGVEKDDAWCEIKSLNCINKKGDALIAHLFCFLQSKFLSFSFALMQKKQKIKANPMPPTVFSKLEEINVPQIIEPTVAMKYYR